jgi:D-glycero-alpha-D-manno-heptose 1-phosphate guanylyltransferase
MMMEAIVLAGGLGTRLRGVVNDVPKCMAPVSGKPFLWYLLTYLTKYDVDTVILSVGYLREIIFKWIDEVKDDFPFSFDYAIEEEPLGTGGGIKLALKRVRTNNVLVLNGDTFFDVDIDKLMKQHETSLKAVTLALKPMKQFERYGTVDIANADGTILAFNEKQYCEEGLINGGVYIINCQTSIFDGLPQKCSFEIAVLEPQCKKGALQGVVQNGYFIDIGIPEDYQKANAEFSVLF